MEEEMLFNMVPVPNTATLNEVLGGEGCSESNSSNGNSSQGSNSRQRRFKGVVLQPNGHWGAQIYSNTRESSRVRIWIGTFESESEAAKAYDTVAVKLGSEDSHRNYPLTALTSLEPDFQKLLTLDAVVKLLRDGSYETKLHEFAANSCSLKAQDNKEPGSSQGPFTGSAGDGAVTYQELFQKELTPSDVGKLNRLVIPKRYAMDCFPALPAGGIDEVQLPVYDREMKCWKFRYCFWRSNHSFVFTGGWAQFVKDRKLKAGDVVTFYWCECREEQKAFYMIDVASKSGGGSGMPAVDLQSGFSQLTINESRPMSKL